MSKFNQNTAEKDKTKNNSGVTAYKMDIKSKLIVQVLTTFFNEHKFYGDNSNEIINNIQEVLEIDPKFIANLAIFARKEMHLRTISHVLVSELAKHNNGKPYTREAISKVVERVDDMTEILSYYIEKYGKPIPASMKKGLADSFKKFDEYSIAKYNRNKEVKLSDILNLTHPKPLNKTQSNMWKRLLDKELETPITWETELSAKGNKKEVWENLISENKLGYMAMLRNLKNIIKSRAFNINKVYDFLSDETKVLKNKQLPFRYYSAFKALEKEGIGTSKTFDTLETAIKISTKNIGKLKGKTLISADISRSMNVPISSRSDMLCSEISVLMMAIANYICEETITTAFDTELYSCNFLTNNGIISNANSINVNGGGTNITLPIRYLLENNIFVDRIIIISDNEINGNWNNSLWHSSIPCQKYIEQYKQKINPNVWVHAIDLMGYGTQQFNGKNTNIIAGWNEKILEFINLAEKGIDTLKDKIENYLL